MTNRVLIQSPASGPSQSKVRAYAKACLARLGVEGSELSLLFCDNDRIRTLNREYRGRDEPTDVLAFSMREGEDAQGEVLLGDVVISIERCREQSEEMEVSFEQELARLLAHGICHLAGMDHVSGGKQADRMFESQEDLVSSFGNLLTEEE